LGAAEILEFKEYSYGASLIPDEDEMKIIPINYGRFSDPNGFMIEIIEEEKIHPLFKLRLNVLDLDETIQFYTQTLGMKLLRRRSNVNNRPRMASLCAYLVIDLYRRNLSTNCLYDLYKGYGTENDVCIELNYDYASEKVVNNCNLEVC
jgi:hypothetical protein